MRWLALFLLGLGVGSALLYLLGAWWLGMTRRELWDGLREAEPFEVWAATMEQGRDLQSREERDSDPQ